MRRYRVTLLIDGPEWTPPLGGRNVREALRLALFEAWLRFFGSDYKLTEVTATEESY